MRWGDELQERIEDAIYEAGAVGELWPQVIGRISDRIGAAGGFLFSATVDSVRWVTSEGVGATVEEYFARGYQLRDERTIRLLARGHAGFSGDLDVFTPEEWDADPIRREFLEPRGFGWGVATGIEVPTGETMIFHCERRAVDGPIDRASVAYLDALRPHLSRAALMSSRLELKRATGTVEGLELMGLAAAVVSRRGGLIAANGRFEGLVPNVFHDYRAGLALAHAPANALLASALQAIGEGVMEATMSVPLPARDGRPPMIVHLSPVTGAAHDIFAQSAAVVVVTPVSIADVPSANVIQGLFDLTPTEARVARALGQGLSIEAIAATHSVAVHTVRNQLRSIFAKTGVNRQADLVGLLAGAPVPGRAEDESPSGA